MAKKYTRAHLRRVTPLPTLIAVFPPADGATNFARDDALMERARTTGETLLRVYEWATPTLSFGRNERVAGRFDPARIHAAGVAAVRRPTGGRALLHSRELTYAIAGPVHPSETLGATYARIAALLASAVNRLGVPAEVARGLTTLSPGDGAPCFAQPVAGEIVVEGRKLIASAQFRDGTAYLQHGSLLIDDDQARLGALVASGYTLPAVPPPATLRGVLGRAPTGEEFAGALAASIGAAGIGLPRIVGPTTLIPEELSAARVQHYRDAAWTWRR
jgi:lipoate-protein ligase A